MQKRLNSAFVEYMRYLFIMTVITILFFFTFFIFKEGGREFKQTSKVKFDIIEHSKQMYGLETLEIADTLEKQIQGLSGRKILPPHHGLLFVYKEDHFQKMWMKDMFFPIDIIWMDRQGIVVHSEKNIHPNTYPKIFTTPIPARYVLEVNIDTL